MALASKNLIVQNRDNVVIVRRTGAECIEAVLRHGCHRKAVSPVTQGVFASLNLRFPRVRCQFIRVDLRIVGKMLQCCPSAERRSSNLVLPENGVGKYGLMVRLVRIDGV